MTRPILLILLLLMLAGFTGVSGAAAASKASQYATVPLMGRDYIRLASWARDNGFLVATESAKKVTLSGARAKLSFEVDSNVALYNGIEAHLAYPIGKSNDDYLIARLDVQTLLEPLLNPPRARKGFKIRRICLDPGHGGKDPGNLHGGVQEKTYTLQLAKELKSQLELAGFKVSLTRSADRYIEPANRPHIAKQASADLFLSLHFNASPNARHVRGVEVYSLTPVGAPSSNARGEGAGEGSSPGNKFNHQNVNLAYQIQRALVKTTGSEDRGMRRARFAVLRTAPAPAVLIEGGFMSNYQEGNQIMDPTWRKKLARGIVEGINAYKRVVEQ